MRRRTVPTSHDPVIRQIAAGDAPALQAFYNSLDPFGKEMFHPIGPSAELEVCEKVVCDAQSGARFDLVIMRGGEILGWAFVCTLEKDYPVLGIGVLEELRGHGFGRTLVERLVEFVRARGNKGIELTVVKSNGRARLLYERFGFEISGEHDCSDGLSYYRMKLDF
jgi:ribosomal protein S18 acetylase RimI-like enzyme